MTTIDDCPIKSAVRKPVVIRCWSMALLFVCLLLPPSFLTMGLFISPMGLIVGQGVFASIVGGLVGRTWLKGFVLSTAIVSIACGILLFTKSRLPYHLQFVSESALGLLWIPGLCFVLAVPCLVIRHFLGWCLTCSQADFIPRRPTRLIDILLFMTTLACLLGMFRIPLAWNNDLNHFVQWKSLQLWYLTMFCFSMCTLFIGIPCTYLAFREKSLFKAFLFVFGFSLIPAVAIGLALEFYSAFSETAINTNSIGIVLAGAVMALNISLGLLSLRCGGVRLLHFEPKVSTDWRLETRSSTKSSWTALCRDEHFFWTAWVVTFAFICSLSTSYFVNRRGALEFERVQLQQKVQQKLSAIDCSISIRASQVVGLHLAPNASPKSLQTFPYKAEIKLLTIADSKLSAEVIASINDFSSLKSLDLGYSDIDERGLTRLTESSRGSELRFLSVAGTKMTPSCFSLTQPFFLTEPYEVSILGS